MNAIPYRCPRCCGEMIETEEGLARNFYGRLVFPKDPPPHLCPNCGSTLRLAQVPDYAYAVEPSEYVRTEILDSPA